MFLAPQAVGVLKFIHQDGVEAFLYGVPDRESPGQQAYGEFLEIRKIEQTGAALAVAVYLSVPYVLWAALVLSIVGIVGLTLTFNKPVRGKTFDKEIWLLDAAIVLFTGYLLFVA